MLLHAAEPQTSHVSYFRRLSKHHRAAADVKKPAVSVFARLGQGLFHAAFAGKYLRSVAAAITDRYAE